MRAQRLTWSIDGAHGSKANTVHILAAVLSVALLALWNVFTFATLTEDNSVLGNGPLPHTLFERFLVRWSLLGASWLIVLIFAVIQRAALRISVSLGVLVACVIAWLINLVNFVNCIALI